MIDLSIDDVMIWVGPEVDERHLMPPFNIGYAARRSVR